MVEFYVESAFNKDNEKLILALKQVFSNQ
ncbi:hypothetical protein LGMK_02050 [Leuconostoc sp. C2]|uniref:Uncharacterized protein n=1 Tax=Leuconostoc kimchii (strain IMSNU 11154 / KCTC 2386 / IH25) TaxID=762051 RepID=D5T070_LEUKI|nr:hypothetical protein LKI_00630 [Leuconostoc kimchii IMSNU 11154]AEJ30470.1 hypothetical protein LGMK_02050 [Leuconostoc sp. C2]